MKKRTPLLLLLIIMTVSCADDNFLEVPPKKGTENYGFDFELPTCNKSDIVRHFAYNLEYNEEHEQAKWVSYMTCKRRISNNSVGRTDNFRSDPLVSSQSATGSDYRSTGYNRGHLAPAGDFKWNGTAMSESFYMSNMSPQRYEFNAGIWLDLENKVRNWALKHDTLYITTAGILEDNLNTIGRSTDISICKRFYKVIFSKKHKKAIGFILEHKEIDSYIMDFAISVDEVEKITGIDYYSGLPDSLETVIEKSVDIDWWSN